MKKGDTIRQVVLGGQDGVVNVLGLMLGVATATSSTTIAIIAGLTGGFAESVSMAAVAYTSSRAEQDYLRSKKHDGASQIKPKNEAWVVGISSLIGSCVPVFPFFFLPVGQAMWTAIAASIVVLFAGGWYKGKITTGETWRSAIELSVIAMLAAFVGFAVGSIVGGWFGVNVPIAIVQH